MINEGTSALKNLIESQETIISKWQKELLGSHAASPNNKGISEGLIIHCQTLKILKELAENVSSTGDYNIIDGGEFQ
jgi:hypothetical protein